MIDEQGNITFRWLQISDLHVLMRPEQDTFRHHLLEGSPKLPSSYSTLDRGGLRALLEKKPVDCVVLCGDVFSKGGWDAHEMDEAKSFLEALYGISGAGKCDVGSGMERLFFCPGNHDLVRAAYLKHEGALLQRLDVIGGLCDSQVRNLDIRESSPEYRLLTECAFGPIYGAMNLMTGLPVPTGREWEARVFSVPIGNDPDDRISFVGINTELTAGRDLAPGYVEADRQLALFRRAHEEGKMKRALKAYSRYRDEIVKAGEARQEHLVFISPEACEEVRKTVQCSCVVILFGHRPLDQLPADSVAYLEAFARECGSELYLSGHAHRLYGLERRTACNGELFNVVSGCLSAAQDGEEYGFSIGTISIPKKDKCIALIETFASRKDMFDHTQWMHAAVERELPMRPRQSGTGAHETSAEMLAGGALGDSLLSRVSSADRQDEVRRMSINQAIRRQLEEGLSSQRFAQLVIDRGSLAKLELYVTDRNRATLGRGTGNE